MTRHSPHVRSGLIGLALGVGLWGIAVGCGGSPGSGTEAEKVPEGIVKLKESMKERAAARKGRPGVPRGAAGR